MYVYGIIDIYIYIYIHKYSKFKLSAVLTHQTFSKLCSPSTHCSRFSKGKDKHIKGNHIGITPAAQCWHESTGLVAFNSWDSAHSHSLGHIGTYWDTLGHMDEVWANFPKLSATWDSAPQGISRLDMVGK